ncbi:hypothetical protein GCM10022286_28130 [Gryllotalpicola daejeonensis]|uniref:ABC transporter permease n=1 Tax=Gryllotalpicola daejeonensis TaxID=993087 RepID=A0ABP7ZMZ5_9MICO
MTAFTAPVQASARPFTPLARVWRIVRLHYANWLVAVVWPWAILIGILLINMTIWYLVRYTAGASADMQTQYTGSIFYLFVHQAIVAIQLMSLTFCYALGLSSTRRDYFLGTALWMLVHAAQFTVGFVLLSYLEQWTNGWGVGGHVFQTIYFGTGPLGERLFTFYFGLIGVMFLGSIFGAVFVRWRVYGLYVVGAIFVFGLLGVAALIGFTDSWGAVGEWFATHSTVGVVAWSIPLTAACAVVGFLALRRAVPRA